MTKLAYLGIPGSFSHAAALASAGTSADLVGMPSFAAIFAAINDGSVHKGVIPIENTLAGSIYDNYDLLDANKLHVCGEYYLPVSHNLLGVGKITADYKTLKQVYSHPKALEQCSEFFNAHPWIETCAYSDTAAAARFVGEQNDPSFAAIASQPAAKLYGLQVLQDKLEDNPHNFTRFLVVAADESRPADTDKCSVILRLPHVPGSLHQALGILADSHCNLTKIESRPLVGKAFEYVFYLDFCYDNATQSISAILDAITNFAPDAKILGLYKQQTY